MKFFHGCIAPTSSLVEGVKFVEEHRRWEQKVALVLFSLALSEHLRRIQEKSKDARVAADVVYELRRAIKTRCCEGKKLFVEIDKSKFQ